ncbi:hypothetical protein FA10DRAFT_240094 [Acaromyces ingoldii]|uniref:NAD(P)-binding domain-containing protein n=1 Tax=Acaromyces ingoldii TaxID=215250 RepID=A0A316YUN4_9BASI|nr:hypothetical protein FA10DRAFT_240094 [Acaromyces ingoldii]PWN92494.1 hypothetical protein FA10DRAFT_240094 [Acaromyces ingoldii]
MSRPSSHVQLLILGSGWTGNFLLPLLDAQGISYAYTSRTGTRHRHAAQDPITFSTAADESEGAGSITGLDAMPSADNIVVVFPLRSPESATRLVEAYESAHPGGSARWIALGSSGAWGKGVHTSASPPSTPMSPRAESEAALLALDSSSSSSSSSNRRRTAVLNLTGLYDDEIRLPANFAKRVGDSKDKLAGKTSLHLIHGRDLARSVVALAQSSSTAPVWGKRWIVSDTHVYDWWQLMTTLAVPPQKAVVEHADEWVRELMEEHGIPSLPRPVSEQASGSPRFLDRALNSDDFWHAINLRPSVGRCDEQSSSKQKKSLI